jgi:FkbM family methyltransferase
MQNTPQLSAFNRVKQCRHGMMLFSVNDVGIGRSLELYGEYAEAQVDVFRQLLRPGDLAVDAGANVGAHTLAIAHLVGPEGIVLAFEPQRLVFQALCANLALNNVTNVWPYQAAVGDTNDPMFAPIVNPYTHADLGMFTLLGRTDGDSVSQLRLDELPLPRCRLIKIDVEGMEQNVIRGAINTIIKFKPALYVDTSRNEDTSVLTRLIDSLGYDVYWHRPPRFNPANFDNNSRNTFGDAKGNHLLCVPRGTGTIAGLERVVISYEPQPAV